MSPDIENQVNNVGNRFGLIEGLCACIIG